jgi:squalene-hopene/tetraprenyl-beta-curcumene cyclase
MRTPTAENTLGLPSGLPSSQTVEVAIENLDSSRLKAALATAMEALLAERNARGFWEGELSSSALSTATAVTALAIVQRESQSSNFKSQIDSGLAWLAANQNADGGWGDTIKSLSNISTTTLCWAAFGAANADALFPSTIEKAERWLAERIGVSPSALRTSHSALARAIIARYGKDRTFSVPILTMCALAGRLGAGREAWRHVISLPFELAAFPHRFFAMLRLPVVSYALPALIAIGQAHHVHAPSRNPFSRLIRNATREKTLRKLTEIQPGNGGFLEATPLTSFVTMSLAGSGRVNHVVTQRGVEFLRKAQRTDGSWPIDTNLSTWCTTLAIESLPESALEGRTPRVPDQDGDSCNSSLQTIEWLLQQQYKVEHPYTHAAPGGWAWTDLPGGVPDADDTSGALLALAKLRNAERGVRSGEILRAAEMGIRWLMDLQNRDGGIPTFCRGWGALPFDRSSADITAHAIRAWLAWRNHIPAALQEEIDSALGRAKEFLLRTGRMGGYWAPLWFGNQHATNEENVIYGTSRVARAFVACAENRSFNVELNLMLQHAAEVLAETQNDDGGWGGATNTPSSVEETALAVEGLANFLGTTTASLPEERRALASGVRWLVEAVENGKWREPSPIGFYFAKLWYFERLYPMIFTVAALRSVSEFNAHG